MPANNLRPKPNIPLLVCTAAGTVILGIFWAGSLTFEERTITLRYFLLVLTGLTAFSTPYILFPDRLIPVLQLGNISNRSLFQYLFGKLGALLWPLFLLLFVMVFGDLQTPLKMIVEKGFLFVMSALFYSAVVFFAVSRYIKCGSDSQFWQESEKGRQLRQKLADYFKYPLDPGSLPSLLNTVLILVSGSGVMITAAWLGTVFSNEVPAVFMGGVFGLTCFYLSRGRDHMVKYYYGTNAFFREFFGVTMTGKETVLRETDQLWWVPGRIKMHVWQFLVQLDRKIPAGRVVAAGHFFIWFIAYQRPDPGFLTAIWVIFGLLHHLFIVLTFDNDMSPAWLFRWIGSTKTWIATRFWMQLRWILPMLLSMNAQLFLFGTPGPKAQILVLLVYGAGGFLISLAGAYKLKIY